MSAARLPADLYDELRELAQDLEKRGICISQVIDALFRLVVNASVRLVGREAVAETLQEMSDLIVAEMFDTEVQETLRPTAH